MPKSCGETIEEFCSPNQFGLIWLCLDLEAPINSFNNIKLPDGKVLEGAELDTLIATFPKRIQITRSINHWAYIPSVVEKLKRNISEIISIYSNYLDPEIFAILNRILESNYLYRLGKENMNLGYEHFQNRTKLPVESNFDTRPILRNWVGASSLPTQSDYKDLIMLFHWCEESYRRYKDFDIKIEKDPKYWNYRHIKNEFKDGSPIKMCTQAPTGKNCPVL